MVVVYHSGNVLGYDWIKRPSAYIEKILRNDYSQEHHEDFSDLTKSQQISFAISQIREAYARCYRNKKEYKSAVFEKVWDATSPTDTLTNALASFETRLSPIDSSSNNSLAEKFAKHNKVSGIRQVSYFIPGQGICIKKYKKPFTINASLEYGQIFHWDIFPALPLEIMKDLWLYNSHAEQATIPLEELTLQVVEAPLFSTDKITLLVSTPNKILIQNTDKQVEVIPVTPRRMNLVVNQNGISFLHDNGWCFTIGGNSSEWEFS